MKRLFDSDARWYVVIGSFFLLPLVLFGSTEIARTAMGVLGFVWVATGLGLGIKHL